MKPIFAWADNLPNVPGVSGPLHALLVQESNACTTHKNNAKSDRDNIVSIRTLLKANWTPAQLAAASGIQP